MVCETQPGTGQCISPVASSVTTHVSVGATPTFGIFVKASGDIPFDPANRRVFVRFRDTNDAIRGTTSVAVQTQ